MAGTGETLGQLIAITFGVPTFDIAVAVEHRHEVEQLAATKGILNQVAFRPAPKDHCISAEFDRHILDW
ncbi:hypothetical protein D3C76_1866570 [compost metagenome]